ncbi:periplasmic binding protein-like II [Xylaria acuta]|nr:periplasmic binding protein-like II [Xylaria acuta]
MHFYAFVPLVAWATVGVCQAVTETRSLDQIHQAALKEGGVDGLKNAFEERFLGMALNVTVRGSSYIGPDIDLQLAVKSVSVDNKRQGVLLNYKPAGFKQVHDVFKDSDSAWASSIVNAWSIIYNKDKLKGIELPTTFLDFLKPEFKNKLIFISPIDDDAVLNTFDLMLPNTTYAATFGTTIGLFSQDPLVVHFLTEGAPFISWAQGAAILKDAPHPESAKLLQIYVLSEKYQNQTGSWSIRRDIAAPEGFESIFDTPNTNPVDLAHWMSDQPTVERLRFWFQDKLGYPA